MDQRTIWKLYNSNKEVWSDILSDCAKAQKSISLEQFIFTDDDFGRKLIEVCTRRAAEGVQVRFLWDAVGSFTFWGSNIKVELRKKGIHLLFWKTLVPAYFQIPDYRAWYLRNHRRTIVIDEAVGYTGSICIDDSLKNWRDTNVRLEGSVASSMQAAFDRMWWKATGRRPGMDFRESRDPEFRYEINNPSPRHRYAYKLILEAIRNAQKYLYVVSPYFVPTRRLLRALRLAAKRGVDVRILIPQKSDKYILDVAAQTYFQTLLESGAKIYLYKGNVIHSKAAVIDGNWATVGSMNWDSASLLYNYEANIVSTNSNFAAELTEHFAADLKDSVQVKLEDWNQRSFFNQLQELFVRLIRKFL